jgi:hypothetical protein
MIRKIFLSLLFPLFFSGMAESQVFVKTADLFQRTDKSSGKLNINQDQAIDTLISRYILMNKNTYDEKGYYGMSGYRIQIYSSSNRNAREESNKARAEFINKFPNIVSYQLYVSPGYFKIRVGDFRSKTEAIRTFMEVSREFPDAYIVPDFVNFPDLVKN